MSDAKDKIIEHERMQAALEYVETCCLFGHPMVTFDDVPGDCWVCRYGDPDFDRRAAGFDAAQIEADREWFANRRLGDLLNHYGVTVSGYVYILKAGDYYKIGRSKTPDERIKTLQIQLPFPVSIVGIIPCTDEILAEKMLHRRYADKRVNGEWFKLRESEAECAAMTPLIIGEEEMY